MKKTLIILTIFILGASSCKQYTCECTAYNSNSSEPGSHSTYPVRGTKAKRKQICTDKSTQPDLYGNYTTCVLK